MGARLFCHLFVPAFFLSAVSIGVLGAGEGRDHYTGRGFGGLGITHTNDIPPAGAIRLQTFGGRERARERAGFGGAGTHVLHDKTSRVGRSHDNRASTKDEDGFCLPPGTGLAWRARGATEEDNDGDGALRSVTGTRRDSQGAPLISHTSSPLIFNLITMYITGRTRREDITAFASQRADGGVMSFFLPGRVGTGRDGGWDDGGGVGRKAARHATGFIIMYRLYSGADTGCCSGDGIGVERKNKFNHARSSLRLQQTSCPYFTVYCLLLVTSFKPYVLRSLKLIKLPT